MSPARFTLASAYPAAAPLATHGLLSSETFLQPLPHTSGPWHKRYALPSLVRSARVARSA